MTARTAFVERVEGARSSRLPYSLHSLEGKRDGSSVHADILFKGVESGQDLRLRLEIDLGPPIRLKTGRFSFRDQDLLDEGTVTADAMTFLGGQSGQPSLGGRFRLSDSLGTLKYRVTLPNTEMGSPFP